MRRTPVLLVVPVLALSACGSSPSGDAARTTAFLKNPKIKVLKDEELARLCPSLYPTDFLARPKHYRYTRAKKRFAASTELRTLARTAGWTSQGTPPKD